MSVDDSWYIVFSFGDIARRTRSLRAGASSRLQPAVRRFHCLVVAMPMKINRYILALILAPFVMLIGECRTASAVPNAPSCMCAPAPSGYAGQSATPPAGTQVPVRHCPIAIHRRMAVLTTASGYSTLPADTIRIPLAAPAKERITQTSIALTGKLTFSSERLRAPPSA
jgi:hypothetical protein